MVWNRNLMNASTIPQIDGCSGNRTGRTALALQLTSGSDAENTKGDEQAKEDETATESKEPHIATLERVNGKAVSVQELTNHPILWDAILRLEHEHDGEYVFLSHSIIAKSSDTFKLQLALAVTYNATFVRSAKQNKLSPRWREVGEIIFPVDAHPLFRFEAVS